MSAARAPTRAALALAVATLLATQAPKIHASEPATSSQQPRGAEPTASSSGPPEQAPSGAASAGAEADTPPSTTRTLGFVLAGVGFVGLGIGTYFAISAAASAGSVGADPLLCTGGVCTEAGRSALAELRTQRSIASLLVGGGMLGLASGAVLLSIDDEPSAGAPAPKLEVGAALAGDGAGLSVGLRF